MKRTVWMMAAVGIVLLGFTACGSAAPESPDESVLFAANGPALTVVEKQPDQYTTDPEDKTVPPEQSPDLLTMNSQEEEGFALFYPLLSETQFRCLMDEDGVDFIPNRLVSCEEGGLAYYSTAAGDLVYCTADFSTVKAVLCQQRAVLQVGEHHLPIRVRHPHPFIRRVGAELVGVLGQVRLRKSYPFEPVGQHLGLQRVPSQNVPRGALRNGVLKGRLELDGQQNCPSYRDSQGHHQCHGQHELFRQLHGVSSRQ